jgi:predicted RNA binding protein YcfA (HicA-like mRNA interferase family)
MLAFFVLCTVVLLLLFAAGQLFPTRVFLGKAANRGKVTKFYGGGALLSFMVIGAFAPKDARKPSPAPVAARAEPAEPAEEKGRLKPVIFQGLTVPGRMSEAKTTGFTDCKADYSAYKCTRAVPTELFGLKTQFAELKMDGRDYFADAYLTPVGPSGDVRELKPEQLAYGTIIVTFARSDYDLKCVDKHRQKTGSYEQPTNCIINKNTIDHFNQALLDAGWMLTRTKGGYYNYVHPRELVEITTKHDTATIRRISSKEVADQVARDEHLRAKQNAADSNAAAVLEQMKK